MAPRGLPQTKRVALRQRARNAVGSAKEGGLAASNGPQQTEFQGQWGESACTIFRSRLRRRGHLRALGPEGAGKQVARPLKFARHVRRR